MNIRNVTLNGILAVALTALLPSCQSRPHFSNGAEYLKLKGFEIDPFLLGQISYENTTKNINAQLPEILQALSESEIVTERPIAPMYTIYLESGSSFQSQTVAIQVGVDGYGVIRYLRERTFFHAAKLPGAAHAAFDKSTVLLRNGQSAAKSLKPD